MPNASGKPLGERLAALANRQSAEKAWKKNPLSYSSKLRAAGVKTQANYNAFIQTPAGQKFLNPDPYVEPTFQNVPRANATQKAQNQAKKNKNCGPKPMAWIGTQKNPAYAEWVKCSSAAAGGKRKTRKSKKSKRVTRRRR